MSHHSEVPVHDERRFESFEAFKSFKIQKSQFPFKFRGFKMKASKALNSAEVKMQLEPKKLEF